jgi:hypothetical protein
VHLHHGGGSGLSPNGAVTDGNGGNGGYGGGGGHGGKWFGVSGASGTYRSPEQIVIPGAHHGHVGRIGDYGVNPHTKPGYVNGAHGKFFGVGGHAGTYRSGHYITIPEAKFSTATTLKPHGKPMHGKYFGVGGHAGNYRSGHYITIPEAQFSTQSTLVPHKAPLAGKYFGAGGHAGAFKSGHYITIPEAQFSTQSTLVPHKAAVSGKYFGAGGHAGAFKSGHYITIPEAHMSHSSTLTPSHTPVGNKYFGVSGSSGPRTSGYVTVPENALNHTTAPVQAAIKAASHLSAAHATQGAHGGNPHGHKFFGTSGHSGSKTSGYVTIPEAPHHASISRLSHTAQAAANKLAPSHNPNGPQYKYFGVAGHAGANYSNHYITVNEAQYSHGHAVKAAAHLANKLAPPAPNHKYFGVSGHSGTRYAGSAHPITVNEADGGAHHAGTVKAAANLANKLAPQPPALNHKYFGVGGHAGTFKSPQIVSVPEANPPAVGNHATGTVKIAASKAGPMKSFGSSTGTHRPNLSGSVKAAAALANKYSGVSGHAGLFKSPQTVAIPEAHSLQAGSVKFAAQQLAMHTAASHSTNPVSAAIAAHNSSATTAMGVVGGVGHGEVLKQAESYTDQSGFDGQGSGHDFNGGYWHPSFGGVNNWDGARAEAFRDYK